MNKIKEEGEFKPEEHPRRDLYMKIGPEEWVIMKRDTPQETAQKKDEEQPMEVSACPDIMRPSENSLRDDEELFAWMQMAARGLKAENRTSHEIF